MQLLNKLIYIERNSKEKTVMRISHLNGNNKWAEVHNNSNKHGINKNKNAHNFNSAVEIQRTSLDFIQYTYMMPHLPLLNDVAAAEHAYMLA